MQAISCWLRRVPFGRAALAAVVVAACVGAGAEALGCPTCKDAVNTADPEGLNVARGYFYSILLMLAMPFTLVSSFGIYVWREMRRQRLAAPEHDDAPAIGPEGLAASSSQTAALQ